MIQLRNMNKRKARFEGWYFKQQNAHHTVAFIPGYHVDEDGNASAFVQVITESTSHQFQFSEKEFSIDRTHLRKYIYAKRNSRTLGKRKFFYSRQPKISKQDTSEI